MSSFRVLHADSTPRPTTSGFYQSRSLATHRSVSSGVSFHVGQPNTWLVGLKKAKKCKRFIVRKLTRRRARMPTPSSRSLRATITVETEPENPPKNTSTPTIIQTTPSQKRRYTLHFGSSAPNSQQNQVDRNSSLRFAHPTVSMVIPGPPSASTVGGQPMSMSSYSEDIISLYQRPEKQLSDPLDLPGVNPATVRHSYLETHPESPESEEQTLLRLDGVSHGTIKRANLPSQLIRQSQVRQPSLPPLPFVARTASVIRRLTQLLEEIDGSESVHDLHRQEALDMLEGRISSISNGPNKRVSFYPGQVLYQPPFKAFNPHQSLPAEPSSTAGAVTAEYLSKPTVCVDVSVPRPADPFAEDSSDQAPFAEFEAKKRDYEAVKRHKHLSKTLENCDFGADDGSGSAVVSVPAVVRQVTRKAVPVRQSRLNGSLPNTPLPSPPRPSLEPDDDPRENMHPAAADPRSPSEASQGSHYSGISHCTAATARCYCTCADCVAAHGTIHVSPSNRPAQQKPASLGKILRKLIMKEPFDIKVSLADGER